MDVPEIRNVVDAWTQQYEEIGSMPHIKHVQIFENKVCLGWLRGSECCE